jgi:hypothetical protein
MYGWIQTTQVRVYNMKIEQIVDCNLSLDSNTIRPTHASYLIPLFLTPHSTFRFQGHMELYMCNLDSLIDEHNVDEVQACLDAFPLEFVRDNSYGIPQDTNYKMRAYFAE